MPQRRNRVAHIKPRRRSIASILPKLPPFPEMKMVKRIAIKHPRWFEKKFVLNVGISGLAILALVVAALLPLVTARASTTLTWSTNGDFSQNKVANCQTTTIKDVVISGSGYTDPTCAASDADANMTLGKNYYRIGDVASYSSGSQEAIIAKKDGTVWTWGDNENGDLGDNSGTAQLFPVQVKGPGGTGFLTDVKAVSAANNYVVAVKNDGTVWAWGLNSWGNLGNGTKIDSPTPVQVKGPGGTGFLTNVKAISASTDYYISAVKNDGTVWSWGYNGYSVFGDGTSTDSLYPVEATVSGSGAPLTNVVDITNSDTQAIALKGDGTVWAWGYNAVGQLGQGDANNSYPRAVQVKDATGSGFLTNVVSISTYNYQANAVMANGSVWGWGDNGAGSDGTGDTTSSTLPQQMKDSAGTGMFTNAVSVSDGNQFTDILKNDGSVYAVGYNAFDNLGNGNTNNSLLPVQVHQTDGTPGLTGIASLAAGQRNSFAVDQDGFLLVWGDTSNSTISGARLSTMLSNTPSYVVEKVDDTPFTGVSQVDASINTSTYLMSDGTVWAMGDGSAGQLGDGAYDTSVSLVQVKNADGSGFLNNITQIATGANFTLALKSDGTVWAWGNGGYGVLGNNSSGVSNLPIQVKNADGSGFLTGVTSIGTGPATSYAVTSDGSAWAWGSNASGQLGNGASGTNSTLPIQVKNADGSGVLTNVKSVTGGTAIGHTLAVKTDGTVWAWGLNNNGQLGDGTKTDDLLPDQVKSSDGTTFLTGITAVSAGDLFSSALKSDGTVWAWGNNSAGQLGIGTTGGTTLPGEVKSSDGSSFLTGVASINAASYQMYAVLSSGIGMAWGSNSYFNLANGSFSQQTLPVNMLANSTGAQFGSVSSIHATQYNAFAVKTDGTVYVWGYPITYSLGTDATGNRTSYIPFPRVEYENVNTTPAFSETGNVSGFTVDAGVNHKYQWNQIGWNSAALPANTSITFNARTSNDGTTWSAWTADQSQTSTGSTTGTADMSGLPLTRFVQLRTTLKSPLQDTTPTLNDFSLTYIDDTTPPVTNASDIQMKKTSSSSATINDDDWTNAATPYFNWTAGADDGGGVGLLGYCLYLGQDSTANVVSTKGLLGTSPIDTGGACQYAVSGTNLDTSVNALATALTTSDSPYYLLVKPIDKAGNVYTSDAAHFSFRFDNTPPTNPSFISAPSQFIATKSATLTWPTSGADAASDADSGLAGLQYKVGTGGTWYGDTHNGAQDISDVLANDGSYQTDPTHDYPLLAEGNNIIYFRAIDNAGNTSTTNDTAVIKINTTSPAPPQNLVATPSTNTSNSFAFSWNAPNTFVGPSSAVTYCYTVNTLPTDQTCTYTPAGQTSLAADAYATQPGSNILYVVAKDEAGNVNYDTYASVTFTANTPAPGIPVGTEIADISTKATSIWKLALSWAAPDDVGAGISKYAVYRSTDGVTFSQTATTSGLSYVDSNLSQQPYYYKIRACDSANNCGAFSDVFSMTPTGRFTTPPGLVTSPSVQVSTKTATFSYVTDRDSDSRIQYGTSSGIYFPGEVAVSALTENHKVEISNLDAGTTYFYKAKWTDEDGNTGISTELSFTTLPAPSIKDVSVLKTTLSSATIQFTSTDASSVNIYYGKTDSFGGVVSINTSRSESTYSIELPGLDDGATYYYKFSTFDADGNEYDSHLANTFTTPARPRISNLRFQPVAGQPTSTQLVTWTTNVLADSTLTYGKVGEATRDLYDATLTTDHQSTISNLDDASEYSLLAESRDASGNLATSDPQTFQTALDTRPPVISAIQVESTVKGNGNEARGQVVLSWKTDEPATSQVAYAQGAHGTNYTSQTSMDDRLSYDHVVIVSDLAVSAIYHLQPISNDKAGNVAHGDDTSAIIGRATDSVLNIIISTLNKIFGL